MSKTFSAHSQRASHFISYAKSFFHITRVVVRELFAGKLTREFVVSRPRTLSLSFKVFKNRSVPTKFLILLGLLSETLVTLIFAKMLEKLFLLLLAIFGTVNTMPITCNNNYRPRDYVGHSRVPTSCKPERLNCPRSWKAGVPKGNAATPKIFQKFLNCHENFTLCGYVPINPKNGAVHGQSGVIIGPGINLESKSGLFFASLPSTLVDKVALYFGLKTNHAACAIIENPLNLSGEEVNNLTDVVTDDITNQVSNRYNNDKRNAALPFTSLPRGIRTALVSIWSQLGNPSRYSRFWNEVKKNDWEKAVKELRNFYRNPNQQARGDLRRRNNEADIIEAALVKCNNSVDLVFLLDESGSVGTHNFHASLEFVKSIIQAFPDYKLSGENGTRCGLSTFNYDYRSHYYLSNYNTQLDYFSAIDRITFTGGTTLIGKALTKVLTEQFREDRGMRPEGYDIPRILIVLTDGCSHDPVSIPAQNVRDQNIAIYVIGVAGYVLEQLKEITSSDSHVYTLDTFNDLEALISMLTSSACYEPNLMSLNKTIQTSVVRDSFHYYSYRVSASSNLKIRVTGLSGNTLIYASRTNPHPYMYDQ